MSCIEVDLEDYKDEVRYTFCENNNCLMNDCKKSFKQRFKAYIDELEKELTIYSIRATEHLKQFTKICAVCMQN